MFSATINICRSSFGFSKPREPSFIYPINESSFKVYLLWADLLATVAGASQATISTPSCTSPYQGAHL